MAEGGRSTCEVASKLSRPSSPASQVQPGCQVTILDGFGRKQLTTDPILLSGKDGRWVFPGCVRGGFAKGGELQNCSEEPKAPSLRHGTQTECSRFRDLQGPTTALLLSREPNSKAFVHLMRLLTQERAGLLVKRDSLTPPRKGLLNQCSVEDEEVGAVVVRFPNFQ